MQIGGIQSSGNRRPRENGVVLSSFGQKLIDEDAAALQSPLVSVLERRFVLEALEVGRAAARIAADVARSFRPHGDDGAPSTLNHFNINPFTSR